MKTALLLLSAASMMGSEPNSSPQACPAPAAPLEAAAAAPSRFDPLVLDLKGDEAKVAPGTCSHAINTKGTGTSGRAAPGPGNDCDDKDDAIAASDSRSAPRESLPSVCAAGSTDPDQGCGDAVTSAAPSPQSKLAIKCKGTSAK